MKPDPNNVKALLRRAASYRELNKLELATVDTSKLAQIAPQDHDVQKELRFLQKKLEECKQKEKEFYTKMFQAKTTKKGSSLQKMNGDASKRFLLT